MMSFEASRRDLMPSREQELGSYRLAIVEKRRRKGGEPKVYIGDTMKRAVTVIISITTEA